MLDTCLPFELVDGNAPELFCSEKIYAVGIVDHGSRTIESFTLYSSHRGLKSTDVPLTEWLDMYVPHISYIGEDGGVHPMEHLNDVFFVLPRRCKGITASAPLVKDASASVTSDPEKAPAPESKSRVDGNKRRASKRERKTPANGLVERRGDSPCGRVVKRRETSEHDEILSEAARLKQLLDRHLSPVRKTQEIFNALTNVFFHSGVFVIGEETYTLLPVGLEVFDGFTRTRDEVTFSAGEKRVVVLRVSSDLRDFSRVAPDVSSEP
jgi:hypothetical protein